MNEHIQAVHRDIVRRATNLVHTRAFSLIRMTRADVLAATSPHSLRLIDEGMWLRTTCACGSHSETHRKDDEEQWLAPWWAVMDGAKHLAASVTLGSVPRHALHWSHTSDAASRNLGENSLITCECDLGNLELHDLNFDDAMRRFTSHLVDVEPLRSLDTKKRLASWGLILTLSLCILLNPHGSARLVSSSRTWQDVVIPVSEGAISLYRNSWVDQTIAAFVAVLFAPPAPAPGMTEPGAEQLTQWLQPWGWVWGVLMTTMTYMHWLRGSKPPIDG